VGITNVNLKFQDHTSVGILLLFLRGFFVCLFTLSRELLLSLCLSGRLFPESVLIREPLESAFLTQLIFGVEVVYGEAKQRKWKNLKQCIYYKKSLYNQTPKSPIYVYIS